MAEAEVPFAFTINEVCQKKTCDTVVRLLLLACLDDTEDWMTKKRDRK